MQTKFVALIDERPLQVFKPAGIEFDDNDLFLKTITNAYSAPERGYHNLKHISEMLKLWRTYVQYLDRPLEVYLAIMFHDSIYDVRLSENEAASAEFARAYLTEHMLTKGIDIEHVCYLINLTAQHGKLDPSKLDETTKLFLDFDMAIMAADRERFIEYEQGILKEYSNKFSTQAYLNGRIHFLTSRYPQGKKIYLSARFLVLFQKKAEENIQFLLNRLMNLRRFNPL
jgi:predicted metal-dependent HD superfamily phosphohydrolase